MSEQEKKSEPEGGYIIEVTFGTRRHMIYAEPSNYADAQALLKAAKERKYHDAKIVTREEFFKARGAQSQEPPAPAGSRRRAA